MSHPKHRAFRLPIHAVIFALGTLAHFSPAFSQSTKFTDLTASKFKGKDDDLSHFSTSDMETEFRGASYLAVEDRPQVIFWKVSAGFPIEKRGERKVLASYKMHFDIKDRRGQRLFAGVGTYDLQAVEAKPGVIVRGSDGDHVFHVSKQLNFNYASVDYWVSDIKWKIEKLIETPPDRMAFSLDDVIDDANKASAQRAAMEKGLVVKFTRPTEFSKKIESPENIDAYLVEKKPYSKLIRTAASWKAHLTERCKGGDIACPEDFTESLESGENIRSESVDTLCEKYGCLALFASGFSYPPQGTSPGYINPDPNPCDTLGPKVLIERCTKGLGLFGSSACQWQATTCHRIRPDSYRNAIQASSETLLIFTWGSGARAAKEPRLKAFDIQHSL